MITYRRDRMRPARMQRQVVCDACGSPIEAGQDALLMRRQHALAVESSFVVHATCAPAFAQQRGGQWDQYTFPSAEASYFMW